MDPARLDLLAAGRLPAAWGRLARADPERRALWAGGRGWLSRGDLDAAGARVAGRLRRAGRAGQRVLERYGMTETIMNVSNPCDGERRPGTVGLPLPGVELRLAGRDQGEVLLLEHPGVAEVAVVGAPSEEWGEQVAAFVVPADPAAPPDRDELLAFAAERLAGFKRPRVLRYVEALPRNALGKVLKHELRP